MCLNIVVTVTYFVGRVMLSTLITDFNLNETIDKRVVVIAVKALYKSP